MTTPAQKRPVGTPPKHGHRALSVTPHPHPRYTDRIRLIRWRRGPDNPTIEASVRLPDGTWTKAFSLRTDQEPVAQLNAVEELTRREHLHASGLPQPSRTPKVKLTPPSQHAPAIVDPGPTMASAPTPAASAPATTAPTPSAQTFGVAAMAVVDRLEKLYRETAEREGRQKANKHLQHLCRLRNVLIPAFEGRLVRDLTRSELNDWMRNLKVPVRGGEAGQTKAPAQSTVGSLGATFKVVMREAAERKWIRLDDAPGFSKRGFAASIPNASFTHAEMEALRDHMTDDWASTAHRGLSKDVKFLLRGYVALASCTGIRPGLELERIHADQIQFERDRGAPVIRIPILAHQAKYQIPRDVYVVERDVFDPRAVLLRLLAWRRERGAGPDSLLFSIPGGAVPAFSPPFKRLLNEAVVAIDPDTRGGPTRPLLIDPETRLPRKPYSLRHYFATQALLRGYPDHILAKWMGTSTAMIDRHYSKVKLRMQAAHLAGTSPEHRAEFVAAALRRRGLVLPDARSLTPREEAAIDGEIAAWEAQGESGWHPHPDSTQPEIPDAIAWSNGGDHP